MMKRKVKQIHSRYITEIMLTYNNDKDIHSATGLTPNEARKEKNDMKAKLIDSIKTAENYTLIRSGRPSKNIEKESDNREGENLTPFTRRIQCENN